MSVSYIPAKVKYALWAQSAGRCEYEGCNKILWQDLVTKAKYSTAYIAHIIADKEGGPRGHKVLSERLKCDLSNLMLLCDAHHRLVDKEDEKGYPVERLQDMKKRHEKRVRILTALEDDKQSHVLHYGANIGRLNARITWRKSFEAMVPHKFPAEETAIELSLRNSPFIDEESRYWEIEQQSLQRQFTDKVRPRLSTDISHLSVFALAPQPLLIELGRLLSDVSAIDVYQHQKEPEDNWKWQDGEDTIPFEIYCLNEKRSNVALNISLSANIANHRIYSILGEDTCIWTLAIKEPYNDFLKKRVQLQLFRETFRKLLNRIKFIHGQNALLNIFPAVPVSIAVEIGRVWMPKADMPLRIYDQNSASGGFIRTLEIVSQ